MKIALASDLHLEFGPIELTNDENADVLILSGDTIPANFVRLDRYDDGGIEYREMFATFLGRVSTQFKHVIMVAGNHEHYHYSFEKTIPLFKSIVADYPNIYFLEKETVKIGYITFIGATLWTDMNCDDPETINSMLYTMNDYRLIKNGDRRLTPEDTIEAFYETLGFIDRATMDNCKSVVVGHHAPSKQSTHPRYANDLLMNGAYSSNLFDFIYRRPQIKLWTHGHTHIPFDYMINKTRIVCNPRGYIGHEALAAKFDLKYVEV